MSERTLKLDDKQIDLMRLILRSPDKGEGWRSVSGTLRDFISATVAEQPELYETSEQDETLMLRLSDRGAVLAVYL